jgi:salicylate hydroxylase
MQLAMYQKAKDVGVDFRFATSVATIDCAKPALVLKSGENVEADLIIGADGLHGMSRSSLLGRPAPAKPTGDLAYRCVRYRPPL